MRTFAERSNRGERTPGPETPRECRPASHSEPAGGEIDSATRSYVPRPIAIGLIHCHVRCYAGRAKAQCAEHGDLAGLPPRHNHGRLPRNQDDGAGVLACPVRVGWLRRVGVLAASRYGWHR
jgi:hypothetical protein